MIRVLSVFGTRPEAVKMAPIIAELGRRPDLVVSRVCATAQHREIMDRVLKYFGIVPDHDLDVMTDGQTPTRVSAAVMAGLEPVLAAERPDWVLVQGDTITTAAAALTAFLHGARVGHIEAGLRTFDRRNPFPEEISRRLAAVVADMHFAPTPGARTNLLREGIPDAAIRVTGNPVIDALKNIDAPSGDPAENILPGEDPGKRRILVTAHRRESFGRPLENICLALRDIAATRGESVQIVFPVHPNPNVRETVHRILGRTPGILLTEPLDYVPFIRLMGRSTLVLTDSGGVQEEAPALGKPVLVLRELSERPEGIEAGSALLVGTERRAIADRTRLLLDDRDAYTRMACPANPYGDGKAAVRIVDALVEAAANPVSGVAGRGPRK